MRITRNRHTLLVSGFMLASVLALPLDAQTQAIPGAQGIGTLPPPIPGVRPDTPALPDASLYTTYSFSNNYTTLHWTVCGYKMNATSCYGYGNLGPFLHVGAAVEGQPVANGNTVTRNIYVVDDAAGSGSGVTLHVYTKTDEVTPSGDVVSVTPTNTIALPLTGGSNAKTYMAGDNGLLYIMTNQTNGYIQMDESSFNYGLGGGFSPPAGGSSITTNKYGYVTATSYSYPFAGFYAMDATGHFVEDGGGADFMLDTSNGISTGTGDFISYPIQTNAATPAPHMRKQSQKTAASSTSPASSIAPQFDSGFFTTYTFWYSFTGMNWITCGYYYNGDGCYGSGQLGPFGHVGAALEGDESVEGSTVRRKIYVVGDNEGSQGGVTLYVYTKIDTYSPSGDKVSVNLSKTLPLPLVGGSQVKTFITGDKDFLYIGTNQGASVIQVNKPNLAYQSIDVASSSSKVSSITTNAYGFVTVTSIGNTGSNYYGVFNPAGSVVSVVNGGDFMLGASNGISTSDNNFTSDATQPDLAKRMNARFNMDAPQNTATH